MTKRSGFFVLGAVAALAALVLTFGLMGAPENTLSEPTAGDGAPAPQYTAEEVEAHFRKLAEAEAQQQQRAAEAERADRMAAEAAQAEAQRLQAEAEAAANTKADEQLATAEEPAAVTIAEVPIAPTIVNPEQPEITLNSGVSLPSSTLPAQTDSSLDVTQGETIVLGEPSQPTAPAVPAQTPAAPKAAATPSLASDDQPVVAAESAPVQATPEPTLADPDPSPQVGEVSPRIYAGDPNTVPKTGTRGLTVSGPTSRPQFPWPPPQASTVVRLPLSRFEGDLKRQIHGEIADVLEDALDQGGYFDRSFWVAPGGFALATRLERITDEGVAVEAGERWPTSNLKERFDLSKYLRALFYTDPGFFRVIVFVLSTEFERTSDQEPTPAEAFRWLRRGMIMLPRDMAEQSVTERHELTALIYEFEREAGSDAVVLAPGRLTGRTHLARARLQRLLGSE